MGRLKAGTDPFGASYGCCIIIVTEYLVGPHTSLYPQYTRIRASILLVKHHR